MFRPGWKTMRSACWSLLAPHRRARRSWSASPTACARAHDLGRSCSSTSSVVGYRWAPSSRLPMARSASGKPSKRYGHARDRDALLAFYDFPAEHWKHLRTTNVIESSFATVRHRTVRSKGCLSNKTALAMIFKLAEAAEKSWRRLDGYNQLPKVILGVKFTDGIEVVRSQAQTAAA